MVTRRKFSPQEIRKDSSYFSPLKTIVETAFYENQVQSIKTVEEAYQLASVAAGTVVLDMPVIHTKELGLPSYARVLLTRGRLSAKLPRLDGFMAEIVRKTSTCCFWFVVLFTKHIRGPFIRQMQS